jgi:hypothetical protein
MICFSNASEICEVIMIDHNDLQERILWTTHRGCPSSTAFNKTPTVWNLILASFVVPFELLPNADLPHIGMLYFQEYCGS